MMKIALLCTNPSPALRLAMSVVVSMLEGHLDIQALVMDPSIYGDEYKFICLKDKYDELQLQSSSEAQTIIDSMVTLQIGSSSTSSNDLCEINIDSA
ncbi:putative LRR receptor-like serine/threonine-protein kinase [Camellia lanceoleosa]|uniref:LRR receptor-like serine/threonine-protein kinase n=1 Tax=Camellia lanceoleosa TaxID=1840588 RepID=A0ACC0GJS9_9ERIC|nr:putative LRR receptor-like serine/threonine-protein kinase [Camellia lanceoleosa]